MAKHASSLVVFALCLVFQAPESPKVVSEFEAKVISVHDGDTCKVLVGKTQTTVRLEAIDAPEIGQSFGTKSKEALVKLLMRKTVLIRKTGEDKYGRTLAFIKDGDVDVNAEMIRIGFAWHFKKYSDDKRLAELEADARKREVGLWADTDAISPWEYRARKKLPPDELNPPVAAATTALGLADTKDSAPSRVEKTELRHWLNTSSGVRHNASCEHYNNTKKGRPCGADEGKACGKCGG